MTTTKSPKRHYWMISGMVTFVTKKKDIQFVDYLNGVVYGNQTNITVQMIARAQRMLQMNLMLKNDNNPDIEIMNVVLQNFIYCGFMTDEEFNKPPENTVLTEVIQPEVVN